MLTFTMFLVFFFTHFSVSWFFLIFVFVCSFFNFCVLIFIFPFFHVLIFHNLFVFVCVDFVHFFIFSCLHFSHFLCLCTCGDSPNQQHLMSVMTLTWSQRGCDKHSWYKNRPVDVQRWQHRHLCRIKRVLTSHADVPAMDSASWLESLSRSKPSLQTCLIRNSATHQTDARNFIVLATPFPFSTPSLLHPLPFQTFSVTPVSLSKKDQRAVAAHKFEAWVVGNTRRSMFNQALPLAQHTCSFAPRLFWNARESFALAARPRELLEMHKILNNDSLLLASIPEQEEHSLAVPVLAGVDFLFVGSLRRTRKWRPRTGDTPEDRWSGVLWKRSQGMHHLHPRHSSSSPSPSSSLLSSSVAQAIMQPVCLCRLTPFIITCGVDADVTDIQPITLLSRLHAVVFCFWLSSAAKPVFSRVFLILCPLLLSRLASVCRVPAKHFLVDSSASTMHAYLSWKYQVAKSFFVRSFPDLARHCCWHWNFQLSLRVFFNSFFEFLICWINKVKPRNLRTLSSFGFSIAHFLSFASSSTASQTMYTHKISLPVWWIVWALSTNLTDLGFLRYNSRQNN